MNEPSTAESPDIGDPEILHDAGVTRLRPDPVNRNEAVAGANDSLRLIGHLLEGFREAGPCPSQTIEAAIRLARMVGQEVVLVGELGSVGRSARSRERRPYDVVACNPDKVR